MTARERDQLAQLRAAYMELLTAARASVAAQREGRHDPLIFVRHVLDAHGQTPAVGVSTSQALAAARDVLALVDGLTLTGVS
jgi:hypothetical protein